LAEDVIDFFAGGEVGGERAIRDEAAEVDDLFALNPPGKSAGAIGLTLSEVAPGTHGVKEVVGGVKVIRNRWKVSQKIAFEKGEFFAVEELLELAGREAGDGPYDSGDAVACFQESGEEAHANVAVGAGEEDVHGAGGSDPLKVGKRGSLGRRIILSKR
jgi:hypothetical protein